MAPFVHPSMFFTYFTKPSHFTTEKTRIIHACILKSALLQSDIIFPNSLLRWYFKSGAVVNAAKLFDRIPQPDMNSWNTAISGYCENSLFGYSWRTFRRMHLLGFGPDETTYGRVLLACNALQSLVCGKQIYSMAMKDGYISNGYVRARMIDLFEKNSCFEDALKVFYDVSCENVVCWNAIISGAVRNAENLVALDIFHQMGHGNLVPNTFTFSSVLTACAALDELDTGKVIQSWVIKLGAGDIFVSTAIVDLYAKCGEMGEAVKEFSQMPARNVVSWTAIISGFTKKNDSVNALKFFKDMINMKEEINTYTLTSVISACVKPGMFEQAIQIHSWVVKSGFCDDSAVQAALINMYLKLGFVVFSDMVFEEMEMIPHSSTWSVLISSFAQSQNSHRAIELLQMVLRKGLKPDRFCSSSIFSVIECINMGRQMHCYVLKTGLLFDLSVGCSLSTMYSKFGSLEESFRVFQEIPARDNVFWGSMISGFAEHGFADKAVQLFKEMLSEELQPDQMTLVAALSACSSLRSLHNGKEIHGFALRAGLGKETLIVGSLVNLYSKCSSMGFAQRVFDMLPQKDEISCSSLISGYAQNGLVEDAVLFLRELPMSDLATNSYTLSSILQAIAVSSKSSIGGQLHALVIRLGFSSEVSIGSALTTMCSKCGSIEDCQKAFSEIYKPDLIAWTAMISSYAEHGKGKEALRVYEKMTKEGIKPDSVTFTGILSACSHNGLLEEGYSYFNSMSEEYGIEPSNRHYACMVDILGRLGRLRDAEKFINDMPIKPDALVWGTLLSSCKIHGNVELGRLAAQRVMELDPCHDGAYVSLSNICADLGQWKEVVEIRSLMEGTGLRKEPGWSLV